MAEYGLHELEDKDLPKTVVRFSITEPFGWNALMYICMIAGSIAS